MCRLKYSKFFDETWENMGLKIPQVAEKVNERCPGEDVTADQLYEFLKGKHCPNAGFAKAVEFTFGMNLPPRYYGWGEPRKP